jgi:hypothetical protein
MLKFQFLVKAEIPEIFFIQGLGIDWEKFPVK